MIQLATEADIPALVALETACFTTDILTRRHFKHLIQSASAKILVDFRDNRLIAFAVILFRKNTKVARLYSIAIDPEFRGTGAAQQIYQAARNDMIDHNMTECRLEVDPKNQRAVSFYKKNGFEIIDTLPGYYEDGTDALRMRCKLT